MVNEAVSIINKVLDGVQGTIYAMEDGNIIIFCKDLWQYEMQKIVLGLVELNMSDIFSNAEYKSFDVSVDIENLTDYHSSKKISYLKEQNFLSKDSNIMSILVVDDDPVACKMIFNSLYDKHYIIVANNGEDGVEEFQKHKPDLVLLDIEMPKMGGEEALQAMIKIDPNAQIIMLSATDDADTMSDFINNGATAFMPKPFNRNRIQNYISNIV